MNIYGFIFYCIIHCIDFLVKSILPHRRAGQMILPIRSFPQGKSNQLPFTGYSCIYPGKEHDASDRYDLPSTTGHLDPQDNQED